MSKAKQNIFLAILALLFSVGLAGFYLYNNEGPDIENANAAKVAAASLYASFTNDSAAAKKLYLDKILEVTGEVTLVTKNQQAQSVILLKTATSGASVNCTLERSITNITAGSKVTIKGICSGLGQGDADMGMAPDVYLSRCYVVPSF